MYKETLTIYWQSVKKHTKFLWAIVLIMPFTILIHQILPPLIAANVLDKLAAQSVDRHELWQVFGTDLILFAVFTIVGGTIMWRLIIYSVWTLEMRVTRDLAQRMFSHLMELDADFHSNSFGGSLVSRTNKLIGAYIRIADTFVFQFYTFVVIFVLSSIMLWSRSPQFVLALLVLSVLYIYTSIKLTRKIRVLRSIEADKENRQTGFLADMVTNVMAVKSFTGKTYEKKRFAAVTTDTLNATNKVKWASLSREMYFGFVTSGIQAIALILAVIGVVVFGAEVGTVFLILTYTNNITFRLWDFSESGLRNLNRGFGDAEEGVKTLMRQPSILDPAQPQLLDASNPIISFNKVSFSHDQTELFKDFDLTIKAGEHIGLVGHSGSGKTTLTRLLLRFSDLQKGAITINGTPIAGITQETLRQHISYVPQEPLLFHRSLAENISYGKKEAKMEEIINASKKAHAHEFIVQLQKGYDTLVGERGVKLSGGQRQRIAIARAMLKDAPILVLDEATSALDSESELLIQDALWKLMEGRTAIVIAHRLSTVQKMDRIIVLDKGKIVEEGTHKQLVKKKGGLYARLWSHQSGGFLED